MASLYDLELEDSNNFIHAIIGNGQTPALKLMLDQKEQFAAMGDVGADLIKQFEDASSDIGKSFKRLNDLEKDIQAAMAQVHVTSDLAARANSIFAGSPDSLRDLSEEDQNIVKEYWLKKKSIVEILIHKGYTPEELFS